MQIRNNLFPLFCWYAWEVAYPRLSLTVHWKFIFPWGLNFFIFITNKVIVGGVDTVDSIWLFIPSSTATLIEYIIDCIMTNRMWIYFDRLISYLWGNIPWGCIESFCKTVKVLIKILTPTLVCPFLDSCWCLHVIFLLLAGNWCRQRFIAYQTIRWSFFAKIMAFSR